MDKDSAFMYSLVNYLFKKSDIKIKTVTSYNHQSSQVEHAMKSLNTICKDLVSSIYVPNYLLLLVLTCKLLFLQLFYH